MTQPLRAATTLGAITAALLVIGLPLMILLTLDPASASSCGATPTGPGPASVPGIPQNLLGIFEGAAQQYGLGNDGWAYLAAFNDAEIELRHRQRARHRGAVGQQLGRGGRADADRDRRRRDRQLGHGRGRDPAGLPGGVQPPSVYNETDAVYGAGALLKTMGSTRQLAGRAGGVERLPARDRAGHPARRAIHPNRPRQPGGANAADVDRARPAGRPGMRASQRADHPRARSLACSRTGWRRSRRARRRRCRR